MRKYEHWGWSDIMFKFLNSKKKKQENKDEENKSEAIKMNPEEDVDIELSRDYKENIEKFKNTLKDSSDVIFREFTLGIDEVKCALVCIDGLIDKDVIHQHIMIPLMQGVGQLEPPNQISITKTNAFNKIKDRMLAVVEISESNLFSKVMFHIMSGDSALIIEGSSTIIIVNTRGWDKRGIQEPESEGVLRGPREGFTETLRANTALIRRRCKDANLVVKPLQIGRRSKTNVSIIYIKDIANPKFVDEVEKRLNKIDVDKVLGSGEIEQLIQDTQWSPFPQINTTERPDKAVANIMEGRIVIIVDGTPVVLLAPAIFAEFLQSPEDYYERWYIGSFIRLLRWGGVFMAVFAPAIYIAVTSFHPGMLPTSLALSVAASRENLPFPAIIEAGLMELTIEFLREAGARLPKPIGQTIGIVGGIIIGDAAVRAGIASPILIVVVALTAIASFIIPSYPLAIALRLVRFPLMLLAAVLGLYGVILGFILLTIHIANLKSIGMSYASPIMPVIYKDLKDTLIRVPNQYFIERPQSFEPVDKFRKPDRGE